MRVDLGLVGLIGLFLIQVFLLGKINGA